MNRIPYRFLLGGLLMASLNMCSGCQWHTIVTNEPNRDPHSSRSTIHIVISNLGMSFPDGMDENENPYLKFIEDHINVDIQVSIPPSEVYEEKLDVIMSSGNLPDMLHTYQQVWLDNYVKQGAFLSLNQLIDEFGPHLQEKIPEEVWDR